MNRTGVQYVNAFSMAFRLFFNHRFICCVGMRRGYYGTDSDYTIANK